MDDGSCGQDITVGENIRVLYPPKNVDLAYELKGDPLSSYPNFYTILDDGPTPARGFRMYLSHIDGVAFFGRVWHSVTTCKKRHELDDDYDWYNNDAFYVSHGHH